MNEELKIIIKAITDEAQKNIKAVRDEIEKANETAKKDGNNISDAMKTISKGAKVAVASITAVTAALVTLGKSTQDVQKNFSKLYAAFQSAGSTAKQAGETYKNLFRFMGDSDSATEAAQNLARITTNTQDLVEWTKILQGVYARAGDAIPIESLSEAANETIQVGKVVSSMADALNFVGVSEDQFNAKLEQTTTLAEREALVRGTLNSLYMNASNIYERNNKALLANADSQAKLDIALAEAGRAITPLITSFNNLSTTLLTKLKPAFEVVAQVVITLIDYIMVAISWISSFFSLFTGNKAQDSTQQIADNIASVGSGVNGAVSGINDMNNSLGGAVKTAKELKRQLMGFDELNVVSSQTETSAGSANNTPIGGGVGGVELPDLSGITDLDIPSLKEFRGELDDVKEKAQAILTLVGLVGTGLLAWKILDFLSELREVQKTIKYLTPMVAGTNKNMWATLFGDKDAYDKHVTQPLKEAEDKLDKMKNTLKNIAGSFLMVAGAVATVVGYSDAWVNGIDWGNFALTLGGLAAVVGGLYLSFGPLAGSIGAVAAGIAAVVLGVNDFISSGATLQNTILIIGGAIATAVGLATAGLSLVISLIAGAVVAIGGFAAALALQESAIKDTKTAQEDYTNAINASIAAQNNYTSVLDRAEEAQRKLEEAEKAAGITGAELYQSVMNGELAYADMTDAQKAAYKAYLDNEQAQIDLKKATEEMEAAMQAEKKAFWENKLAVDAESGAYDEFKKAVIDAYEKGTLSAEEARELIGKSMSEMSDAAQQTFMEDLPSDIKNGLDPSQYETARKRLGDWFSAMGEGFIKNIWNPVKSFWNKHIAPVFTVSFWKEKFNAVKEGAKAAINGAIDAVERGINYIIDKINTLSWTVPEWVPLIGGETWGFNFNRIRIPRLAEGGIAVGDTLAHIGEDNYREAVLPLDRNTGWMEDLAKMIAKQQNNAPTTVALVVDGKQLGWATIRNINAITNQTGRLQLVL